MRERYLEVTFRRGKPVAAYLYLAREASDRSTRVDAHETGVLIDRTDDGRAIGIEIPNPSVVTLESLNRVLDELSEVPLSSNDMAPLTTA
jgi:uncharacterized protein YuzE